MPQLKKIPNEMREKGFVMPQICTVKCIATKVMQNYITTKNKWSLQPRIASNEKLMRMCNINPSSTPKI